MATNTDKLLLEIRALPGEDKLRLLDAPIANLTIGLIDFKIGVRLTADYLIEST